MIKEVTFEKTTFNDLPYKYEAGTPNIADTIAFRAALDFITDTGKKNIRKHEESLLAYATAQLEQLPGLKIIGKAKEKVSVISFVIENIHPQDIGILLDNRGIAVRTGHHCTQPLMTRFGIEFSIDRVAAVLLTALTALITVSFNAVAGQPTPANIRIESSLNFIRYFGL